MKIQAIEEIMKLAWTNGITIPYVKMKADKNDKSFVSSLENISVFKYESECGPVVVEVENG